MRRARSRFEYFGLRTLYDRYLLQAPDPARSVIETPQHFWMRIAVALQPGRAGGASSCISCSRASTTSRARRRCSTPGTRHEQLSSCFLLDSPEDSLESHLRPLQGHRAAVEVLRRHRHRLASRALGRLADPRHQRPLQRHRAVAEDARLLGRRGQPGRQAQGRGLRVPGALACRHRGVPRAARQHRR